MATQLSIVSDTKPAPPVDTSVARDDTVTKVAVPPPEPKADPAPPPADRPSWLPEKYKTPEEFAKAHKELEAKLGKPKDPPPADPAKPDAAQKAVADAGLDMSVFEREYIENGKLSDASFKTLESKGIKRSQAEAYIEGQKARAAAFSTEIAATVGGQEALDGIMAWASTALSEDEKAAANAVLASNNKAQAKLVMQGLKARYTETNGSEPELANGQGVPTKGLEPFESTAQLMAAMQDSRYAKDPAYRAKVEQRLGASDMFRSRF